MASVAGARDTVNGRRLTPCFGAGRSAALAARRALDEFAERWSGFARGDEPELLASYEALGEAAVHPDAMLLFGRSQLLEYQPFDETEVRPWTPALSLTSGKYRMIAAPLVWYGHPAQRRMPSGRADSSGCAAGGSLADAAKRGLLELIERDSVALWWYNRIRRPQVELARTSLPMISRIVAWLERLGRQVWVLDLTSDLGVPVMAAVSVIAGAERPRILLGFGAHPDSQRAALRALTEVAQEVAITAAAAAGMIEPPAVSCRWLRNGTLQAEPQLKPAHGAMIALSSRADIEHPAESLRRTVLTMKRHALDVLIVDQTRAATGRTVVKMFAPGLRPWWRRTAPGRLYTGPVAAGWIARPRREGQLNSTALWF